MILPRDFYARGTLAVARDLLGKILVHRSADGVTAGSIVEVEAYIGEDDPACHAAPGLTRRNEPLYGEPGYAYVYLNYGVHDLFNVVTERTGKPAAVLVRALEPADGIDLMKARRVLPAEPSEDGVRRGRRRPDGIGCSQNTPKQDGRIAVYQLCRGPGNLTRAMGITLADNRADLCSGDRLFLEDCGAKVSHVVRSPRIGIAVGRERLWRFCVRDSPAVSGRRR